METTTTTTTTTSGPTGAAEALAAAAETIGAVTKQQRNNSQGWIFRGIDDVINAVGPVFHAHRITIVPNVIAHTAEPVTIGSRGTRVMHVTVTVEYAFHHGDDHVTARVVAESMDSGDKATAKAMSVALRTCLLQVLALPTDEKDPDADVYELAPTDQRRTTSAPAPTPATKKAVTAAILAAPDTETLRTLWDDATRTGLEDLAMERAAELAPAESKQVTDQKAETTKTKKQAKA